MAGAEAVREASLQHCTALERRRREAWEARDAEFGVSGGGARHRSKIGGENILNVNNYNK